MKVLWVFGHPEPRSLNGSLRDDGVATLRQHAHQVCESDLYAMGWNPVVTGSDYGHDPQARLDVYAAARQAYDTGQLSEDIQTEQDKLRWADTLVVQFPLWWFGMPAILKGWFDRVFVTGFAQGVKDPATGQTLRYGSGGLTGKRAMVIVTVGAPREAVGPRGIHGDIHDTLFPLQHGSLWYPGIAVVPPFVLANAGRLSSADYDHSVDKLRDRLLTIPTTPTIPFRHQERGDYGTGRTVLRPDLQPGESGNDIHYIDQEREP